MAGGERGKGQIMLSEEWLRVIQDDRRREIESARRVHEAREAHRATGRFRTWLDGRSAGPGGEIQTAVSAPCLPARSQAGRAATDPSA